MHTQLWNGWKRLAAHAVRTGATLTIEWANDSDLHRQHHVRIFVEKYQMKRFKAAGCVFGLKSIIPSTRGLPLCKAWGIWTNSAPLATALSDPRVLYQGGHPSTPVSGANTAHSGAYPNDFAHFVNTAFSTRVAPALDLLRQSGHFQAWQLEEEDALRHNR